MYVLHLLYFALWMFLEVGQFRYFLLAAIMYHLFHYNNKERKTCKILRCFLCLLVQKLVSSDISILLPL